VDENKLGDFFHHGGCNVKDVQIPQRDGQSRGFALIEFIDRESLVKALTAHDAELDKRRITVSVSEKTQQRGDRGGGGRDGGRHGRGDGREGREDSGPSWSRGEARPGGGGRGNARDNRSPRGGPVTQPGVVGTTAPATRPLVKIQPRQVPLGESRGRVSNSSIFGEGKPRDEVTPTAASSLSKQVKELSIDSSQANTVTESTNVSAKASEVTGGDKKKDQKTPRENIKKERTTPRDRDNKKSDAKRDKGDLRKSGNTPKGQERRTPTAGDAKVAKKGKGTDKDKNEEEDEQVAKARFEAANEKMRKPVVNTTTQPTKTGGFFALMSDDDSDSN
jgi:RNA recognition motif-containing protein